MFRALHISDIHFGEESVASRSFRNRITETIQNNHLSPDCLIISGDLFNRSTLDASQVENYRSFLQQIVPELSRVYVVPGNHDLDRSAQKNKDGSYNNYTTRRKLVNEKGDAAEIEGGRFDISTDDEKAVMYQMAFHGFISFSQHMGFQSFCDVNAPLDADNYEVQIKDFKVRENETVRFVLINTALIAGQSAGVDTYRERQKQYDHDIKYALEERKPVEAAEINLKKAKLQDRYEKDGELIIDDNTISGTPGRMSLSRAGNRILSNLQPDGAVLTIFVGHHGFQYLASETQSALEKAMQNCRSGIYLCGHAHRESFTRILIGNNTDPGDIFQFQAGVLFKGDTEYTQFGFNYLEFDTKIREGEEIITGKITCCCLDKTPSGQSEWTREPVCFEMRPPIHNQPAADHNLREAQEIPDQNLTNPTKKDPKTKKVIETTDPNTDGQNVIKIDEKKNPPYPPPDPNPPQPPPSEPPNLGPARSIDFDW